MKVIRHGSNVHELQIESKETKIAMLSDLHWDNPKCDRDLLKKHLDYCKENNIPVMVNGDFFCLMQGRGDNRRNKSDIRPEHNNAKYLDSVVTTAVEWFTPYADILTVIGYGNHETGIIKWQETDILQRFVDLLNLKCNSNVQTGGYGGWLIVKMIDSTKILSVKIKYFHGSGGGGVVTKGALNLTRALELYEGCDVYTMGHIHENSARNDVRDTLNHNAYKGYYVKHKPIHLMITGTYKEEYQEGAKGWHVERGAPIKPVGGRFLTIKTERDRSNKDDVVRKYIDSHRIF
jgi:Icc-related predicted phosphoesterase|tara:strand:- start:79 stop:951 length:873 start_codon:yes stop_codon:yes gene_type:complete